MHSVSKRQFVRKVFILFFLVLCAGGVAAQAILIDTTLKSKGPGFPQEAKNTATAKSTNSANTADSESAGKISQVVPPSPTAASLGKWAEAAVSPYTGTISTSIPFYTITDGDLKVPITLSYHHGGIRVEEEASWVGLGWSLDAGGVITRTIRGSDDLNENTGYAFHLFPQNFTLGGNNPEADAYYQEYYRSPEGLDTEPDLFFFNVGGISGKFVLEAKSPNSFPLKGIPLDRSNVQITCNKLSTNNYQWIIVAPTGITYTFSEQEVTASASSAANYAQIHESTGNYTNLFYSSRNTKQVSTWFISSIQSENRASRIEFDYYSDKLYTSTSRLIFSETYKEVVPYCPDNPGLCRQSCGYNIGDLTAGDSRVSLLTAMQNKYLKSIRFTNGIVEFITEEREDIQYMPKGTDTTWPFFEVFNSYGVITTQTPPTQLDGKPQRLKEVQVKDKSGLLLQKWTLNYGYFNQGLANMSASTLQERVKKYNTLRLRLQSVQQQAGSLSQPPFSFTYVGDESAGDQLTNNSLPSKVSARRDLFGYYNGQTANDQGFRLIAGGYYPLQTFNGANLDAPIFNGVYYIDGIDRRVDDTYKTKGSLSRINYPTGGTREFIYASHEAKGGKDDVLTTTYKESFFLSDVTNTYFYFKVKGQCGDLSSNYPDLCHLPPSTVLFTLSNGTNSYTVTMGDMTPSNCNSPSSGITQCDYLKESLLIRATPGQYVLTTYQTNRFQASVTVFQYKNTDYTIVKLGGLRIEMIKADDGIGPQQVTRYRYEKEDGTPSSVQLTPIVKHNYGYIEQYTLSNPNNNTALPPVNCQTGLFGIVLAAKSLAPLGSSLGGNHVGYSRVIEERINGVTEQTNGNTIYEYLNEPLTGLRSYRYFANDAPTFPSYGNGMMTRQTMRDQNGALQKETLYDPVKGQNSVTVKGVMIAIGVNPHTPYMFVTPFYYDVRSEHWYNQKITDRSWFGGNYVEKVSSFSYTNPAYVNLTRQTETESKSVKINVGGVIQDNRVIETTFKYPYDFTTNSTFVTMTNRNLVSSVVEKQINLRKTDSQGGVTTTPLRYEATTFSPFSGNNTTYYLPSRTDYRIGAGPLQAAIESMNYDSRGNLTAFKEKSGITTKVSYFGPSDAGKTDLPSGYTIGGGSSGTDLARTVQYDYSPLLGVSSITSAAGIVINYLYDKFGRLIETKEGGNVRKTASYNWQTK